MVIPRNKINTKGQEDVEMAYALFVIAPAPGEESIDQGKWNNFLTRVKESGVKIEASSLLNRGIWQFDLSRESHCFHELIAAATVEKISFRYMITEDQIPWVFS